MTSSGLARNLVSGHASRNISPRTAYGMLVTRHSPSLFRPLRVMQTRPFVTLCPNLASIDRRNFRCSFGLGVSSYVFACSIRSNLAGKTQSLSGRKKEEKKEKKRREREEKNVTPCCWFARATLQRTTGEEIRG